MKRFSTALLCFILFLVPFACSCQTLGPAHSAQELRDLVSAAQSGDTVLIQGTIDMGGTALSDTADITLASSGRHNATIIGLRLQDAHLTLSGLSLRDSLVAEGQCDLTLSSGVDIEAVPGRDALVFSGSGMLLVEPGCSIQGGSGAAGVSISHKTGDLYVGMEGTVRGGDGDIGGSGIVISPLSRDGVLLLDGDIRGGHGQHIGGSALNLYGLRDNAYVSVTGSVSGGSGPVGGDGVQIVSLSGSSCVGISGIVSGGDGDEYGGNALLMMDAGGSSTVGLSGQLTGGDSHLGDGEPGRSLLVADSVSIGHAVIDNCMLEDGSLSTLAPTPILPEITSSIDTVRALEPTPEPPLASLMEETAPPAEAGADAPEDADAPVLPGDASPENAESPAKADAQADAEATPAPYPEDTPAPRAEPPADETEPEGTPAAQAAEEPSQETDSPATGEEAFSLPEATPTPTPQPELLLTDDLPEAAPLEETSGPLSEQ